MKALISTLFSRSSPWEHDVRMASSATAGWQSAVVDNTVQVESGVGLDAQDGEIQRVWWPDLTSNAPVALENREGGQYRELGKVAWSGRLDEMPWDHTKIILATEA